MHDVEKTKRWFFCLGVLAAAVPVMSPAAFAAQSAGAEQASAAASPQVNINEYIVRGNTVLSAREIEKAVYPFLGPQRTLADVEGAQQALQQVYHSKGYQSVYVALPEQQVSGGVVYLQVTETKVGRVRVLGAKYHSPLTIRDEVPALAEDKVPDFGKVQEELTAIGRSGKRQVTPTVKEGLVPGTMDVDLNVDDKSPWSGNLTLNNDYSADTRPLRTIASLSNSNLWQKGHSASLTFFTAPEKMDNAKVWSASYSLPLADQWALRFSGYTSNSEVASVGGTNVLGKGHSYGAAVIYTLPSEGDWTHQLTLGLDFKNFDENVTYGGAADKVPLKYAPFTFSYNGYYFSDRRQGNLGLSIVAATSDLLGYGSDFAAFDRKRYRASTDFAVLKGEAGLTEQLGADWQLAMSGAFQVASGPLVSNEQFSAGGATSVRGYLAAERAADDGVMGTVELRTPSIAGWVGSPLTELRLHLFTDAAQLWLRDALPEQKDSFNMASVGVGASAGVSDWLSGNLDLGLPLIAGANTEKNDPRAQFSVSANF
ncbi:Heme/hemopexin transporter protein huxB precursor [Serratia entomophila]|uniref:ShlB/FhaC/HecB family hemolysin secretion/activation protein n=1 Tax=Serratia entomophila TaxID=42906 RepID=UPI00217C6B2E|nr:POTRA domain-containing protein [Serratia entomophila]CAI0927480.1 Heme/hemopexin transporter protein huxB precursor [Serratia entomophila]CAI0927662.1 Heme/hemopexin transporter protein huxB precursor [Serratia entomophila]CAI2097810.1 Heme/hemopexin transporter protein huxB precursor [Serratia entomophila]